MKRIWLFFFVGIFFTGVCVFAESPDEKKRERLRRAVEEGVLSIYDIPLSLCARLGMWDEIEAVFSANNRNRKVYDFSGLYYSRPYVVDGKIWVFENPVANPGGLYIFNPADLVLEKKRFHPEFIKYEGGVRRIIGGDTVISGGSDTDRDVDSAVIWNTTVDSVRTVRLMDGHYVGAIRVGDGQLYIGSCGEIINTWRLDTLDFQKKYSTGSGTGWNEKECITEIGFPDDGLVGVGEQSVFVWDIKSGRLKDRRYKHLPNSIVYLHEDFLVEFSRDRFVTSKLSTGRIGCDVLTEKPIEDLIVTREKILSDFDGLLIILSLRHNKGFLLYDFETGTLLRKFSFKGETLSAYGGAIFASDDRSLYRYDVGRKDEKRYRAYLEENKAVSLDDADYENLVGRLHSYPEALGRLGLGPVHLEKKGIKIDRSFSYGRIDSPDLAKTSPKYGYKAVLDIGNSSDSFYFVEMVWAWGGSYDEDENDEGGLSLLTRPFFIAPKKSVREEFDAGEKEPGKWFAYPLRIKKVGSEYYNGFMLALSRENEKISLIERYLEDPLVRRWHPLLAKRKEELAKKDHGFGLFRWFR